MSRYARRFNEYGELPLGKSMTDNFVREHLVLLIHITHQGCIGLWTREPHLTPQMGLSHCHDFGWTNNA